MKTERVTALMGALLTVGFIATAHYYYEYRKVPETARKPNRLFDVLEVLDLRFNDIKYKLKAIEKSEAPVVLIAIDDDSIREVGRFPWDRDIVGQITERAIGLGASAVAFDVINSEPQKGLPEADQAFKAVIEKYPDKIVLGTFSETAFDSDPYKDYCVTEAFLANGGDQLVKLNPSFVVDDISGVYDNLEWNNLFKVLFFNQREITKVEVLKSLEKQNEGALSAYQKNYLASIQGKSLFEYCKTWLTKEDFFLQNEDIRKKILPLYQEMFSKEKGLAGIDTIANIKKFKTAILEHPIPQYGEWTSNIPEFQVPASYTASFIAHLDPDGYVRRYPLFFRSGNRLGSSYIPSLALQTYLVAKGYRADVRIEKLPNSDRIKGITEFKIVDPAKEPEETVINLPVDSMGRLILNYYGKQMSLPYVSAKELLNDSTKLKVRRSVEDRSTSQIRIEETVVDKKEFFKGRAAMVGATAIALYDLRNTPIEANYPGPEIHLTMLANLLDQVFVRTLPNEQMIFAVLMAVLGLATSVFWAYAGALGSLLVFLILGGVLIGVDTYLFFSQKIVTSSIFILLLIAGIYFFITIFKYFSEEAKKKEIKSTFSKYVSPAVVDELLKSAENLKLGGRKQVMTVFFSDVRGFTTISEKLSPTDLSKLLNRYLTPMTELVFKNTGTLDKYMGDAIMAFFGAPILNPQHPHQACRCALQNLVKLKEINDEFRAENLPEIDIGIGINTGEMSVGNMGSNIVQNYTVMGDSVNLASRLEGINKTYGTRIIISEFTQKLVSDTFVTREVDRVKVKGKLEPVRIFELVSEGAATPDQEKWITAFTTAYSQYHQRKFAEAIETFSNCIRLRSGDPVSDLYIERCNDFIAEPPPEDWDGVYESKTK